MTARAISIENYHAHIASGKALRQWMRIYTYIAAHSFCTRSQIAEATGIRLSSVCGRVNELMDPEAGLVIETQAPVRCPVTQMMVHGLRVNKWNPTRPLTDDFFQRGVQRLCT